MSFLLQFLTVVGVHLLAVMSPGPDFVMITRQSLMYSRRIGVYSSIGLGLGILVHVAYSLLGIGFIIAQSILVFSVLKFIGAAYLIYLGYKSFRSGPSHAGNLEAEKKEEINRFEAIKIGFLTNVTNPKATLFFLSLFTLVVDPATPLWVQIFYGLEMSVATFLWFALVSYFFSSQIFKAKIQRFQRYIEKVMGTVLIFLGIKLALASSSK